MNYTDNFNGVPLWNLISICVIVALLVAWELYGCKQMHMQGLTITYCVRTIPIKWRWGIWVALVGVLTWHFFVQKAPKFLP